MTSEVTQAALEPCPVCGQKPRWRGTRSDYARGIFRLQCLGETHLFQSYGPDENAAIAAWNTRLTAQSGEGRSGAGEDAGPFHVSQSGDGKKLWFSARDPASGVTIPARDRTDARNLVSSLNHACATFAALNARQSGEGERE